MVHQVKTGIPYYVNIVPKLALIIHANQTFQRRIPLANLSGGYIEIMLIKY